MVESATRETSETRETATIVPVTGAIYSNGQEEPSSRWSFEIGLNLTVDKFLSTVLKRLEKGYGIKDKCAALNITKFKFSSVKFYASLWDSVIEQCGLCVCT